jgi:hypothetical protein
MAQTAGEVQMRIGEIMLKIGCINEAQMEEAIKEQEHNREISGYQEPIGNILIRKGIIREEQLNKSLVSYFQYLINDNEQPSYVRETAKVAMRSMERKPSGNRLSEETKLTLLKKIHEHEEAIAYLEKSLRNLSNMEQKKIVTDTIKRENKEINQLMNKIEILKKDLECFS